MSHMIAHPGYLTRRRNRKPGDRWDRIWRLHPSHRFNLHDSRPIHLCTTVNDPAGGGLYHRQHLDPLALGNCAYCGEPLEPGRRQAKPPKETET